MKYTESEPQGLAVLEAISPEQTTSSNESLNIRIPKDFDAALFFNDESYRNSLVDPDKYGSDEQYTHRVHLMIISTEDLRKKYM